MYLNMSFLGSSASICKNLVFEIYNGLLSLSARFNMMNLLAPHRFFEDLVQIFQAFDSFEAFDRSLSDPSALIARVECMSARVECMSTLQIFQRYSFHELLFKEK